MRMLVAGPFVGEFGWELMGWQAQIRALSRRFDRTIVISRPESEYLYRDFCDRFEPWSPGTWQTQGYECKGGRPYDHAIHARYPGAEAFAIRHNRQATAWLATAEPEFRRLGLDVEPTRPFDLVVHARAIPVFPDAPGVTTNGDKAARNWPADHWHRLCAGLARRFSIAAVGLPDLAFVPEGATDCRGLALDQQCAVLARARLAIGPSSGPIHLASLCGCPHVVWTKAEQGIPSRYAREWNPLGTKVCIITREGWQPPPELVLIAVRRMLEGRQTETASVLR